MDDSGPLDDMMYSAGREMGYRKLSLDVADSNPGAARLYRRLGFKATVKKVFSGAVSGFPDYHKMPLVL